MSESKYISRNIKDTFSLTDTTVLDKIIEITSKKKVKCYLVGGAVRDIILGKTPKDFTGNKLWYKYSRLKINKIKYGLVIYSFSFTYVTYSRVIVVQNIVWTFSFLNQI